MNKAARLGTVAAGVVVAALLAVGFATATDSVAGEPAAAAEAQAVKHEASLLTQARTECSPDQGTMGALTETSEGQITLVIDGVGIDETGYEDPSAEVSAVFCMLEKVGAPTSVSARMQDTRALDGMQDVTWGDYEATWTYHPDSGMNVIITEN